MVLTRSTLVSVKWLRDVISSVTGNYRLLDASWYLPNSDRNAKAEYSLKHIPGALFFDIDECSQKDTHLPHMLPSAPFFEGYVGSLGINNETHVVLYDNHPEFPLFSAQRVWWMLRVFGHENVSILEGGLPKWLSEGGEVTPEVPRITTQTFKAKFNPSLVKSYEDLEKNVATSAYQVVDVRPEGRFKGIAPEPRADTKPGCISGSKNIPFFAVMNLEERAMKKPEEIKAIFQQANVDVDKPFVASCGSGISGCVMALAAHLCGNDDVAVYDGSWVEWYHRAPAELKQNVPKD